MDTETPQPLQRQNAVEQFRIQQELSLLNNIRAAGYGVYMMQGLLSDGTKKAIANELSRIADLLYEGGGEA